MKDQERVDTLRETLEVAMMSLGHHKERLLTFREMVNIELTRIDKTEEYLTKICTPDLFKAKEKK